MQHYELMYIVPMSFTVNELPEVTKKVTAFLTERGAEIGKNESLGKLKFAYPLEKMSHGYYQLVEFDMDPANVLEVDTDLKLSNQVLRYILTKKKIKSEDELAAEQRLREKIAEQDKGKRSIFDDDVDEADERTPIKKKTVKAPVKTEKTQEEKVSIEDLDKKLDAILEGEDMLQ